MRKCSWNKSLTKSKQQQQRHRPNSWSFRNRRWNLNWNTKNKSVHWRKTWARVYQEECQQWGLRKCLSWSFPSLREPHKIGSDFQLSSQIESTSEPATTKFSYLKELIDVKVRKLIDGLPFIEEGYLKAKALLEKRYGQKKIWSHLANAVNSGYDRGERCLSPVFFAMLTCWHLQFPKIFAFPFFFIN